MFKKNEAVKILVAVIAPIIVVAVVFFLIITFANIQTTIDTKETQTFASVNDKEIVSIFFNSAHENDLSQELLKVEVVTTSESITQGLSGRSTIGADGMLFIFQNKAQQYFWMKDMLFNLDIIWIADTTVVGITKAVQKPEENTPDNRLKIYPSEVEVDMVLELPAGDVYKYGITQGQTIQLAH